MFKHTLANIISRVAEPVLILLAGVFILIWKGSLLHLLYSGVFLIVVLLFVGGGVAWQYLTTRSQSLELGRDLRNLAYLLGVFGFTMNTFLFGSALLPDVFWMNLSMLMMLFFTLFYLVNHYFDKASMHMGMLSFWTILLVDVISPVFALGSLLLLPVAWARLTLKKHTWEQLMWGLAIGAVVGLLGWGVL